MSVAHRIFHGAFGRIALLGMDQSLVAHAHSECHVLLKASGGDTFFSVRNRQQPLTDKTAVLINALEPHSYVHKPGANDTLILALYINPDWLAALHYTLAFSGRPDFFLNPCIELSPVLRRKADSLISEMLSFGTIAHSRLEDLLFDLMISISEKHSDWRHLSKLRVWETPNCHDARIRKAKELIFGHPEGDLDIGMIARECGLSRAQFFALFKKNTSMTPQMFANIGKMQTAFQWLSEHRSCTLGNLSDNLGFSSQGHFTRFFRRHIGAAPSQYQRTIDVYPS
ncbi:MULTISPECIES: AraC family transcriptional regulator [unclassified Marinobacter]|jgi:AraC-like DNA-binding protein|uniref:helix-turn-helix transcriptional regulator n=1 Tax=unclassified Marinobacter TaxID=83889 RepID=UPI00200FEC96|nr:MULTISPECIES: AraC family transcriptional regulator [unclassified Marinobacter]MCL1481449.1 AraC family transcriptional regulator [Marinobacter sp.]UQG54505.1 AraC family transcriptional regulator [Marinobacter sp. M4C]UQG63310.1 AraC family transcriptional regulator [Marinobacter sp. M2C]UQG67590.1 AraC family transcriptional regulator [Marinobacter sp. M1C]